MFNVIVGVFLTVPQAQVAIYIVQDLCLLLAVGTLCVQIFSSWLCLSGLLGQVARNFGASVTGWVIYFGLTLGLHVWAITQWYQNNGDVAYLFTAAYRALFTVQRIFSYIYYYAMFRNACELRSSDGRKALEEGLKRRETIETVARDNPPLGYSHFLDHSPAVQRFRI